MEEGKSHIIVFSGDIGNSNDLILPNLQKCEKADTLYVESTYGDRNHGAIEETIAKFKKIVLDTLSQHGTVLIPSFAAERTQEILCILRDMHESGELPKCKVFLDSPMVTKATEVYKSFSSNLNIRCQKNVKFDGTVFNFEGLNFGIYSNANGV